MVAEDRQHRHVHALAAAERLLKDRRFGDRQPHVEADEDQHGAREKRQPPAECEELLVGEPRGEQQEDAAGEEEPDRRAELREHAVPRALAGRRVLDRQQHRAAPLAAETEALAEATQREENRRRDTDRAVGRQRADGDGGQAHRQQRGDQRGLAADAVAEVAEERRADRPRDEGDRERRQRGERGGRRIRRRKEQARKDEHRRRGVDVEVEELDRGADQAGEQHLSGTVDRLSR